MEHELADLATKSGLDYWLKYAGKDTTTLLDNGGLTSMVGLFTPAQSEWRNGHAEALVKEVGDIVWLVQDSKLCRRLKWAIVKSGHPDHDGVVRDAIVRDALLEPGPEPHITGFNKKGPFKTELVAVQNLAMMYSRDEQRADKEKFCKLKPGGSAEVSWDTSKEHVVTAEKHDQGMNGSADDPVLMHTQEERTVGASHYTGHLKVTIDESHDGISSAPHSTRDCGQQETDRFDYGTVKHEVQEIITGHTTTNMEEEINQKGNVPHDHNWQQKVQTVTCRTDNGAVHTFARTDAAGESDAHTRSEVSGCTEMPLHLPQTKQTTFEDEESIMACSAVVHNTKVTDVGSKTTVGSFSRRIETGSSALAPINQKLEVDGPTVAKTTYCRISCTPVHPPHRPGLGHWNTRWTDATGVSDAHTSTEVSGSARMSHLLQHSKQSALEDEKSLTASSTVVYKTQVTDVGSQTTVGSFSRRTASGTTLAQVDQELKVEVLAADKRDRPELILDNPLGFLTTLHTLDLDIELEEHRLGGDHLKTTRSFKLDCVYTEV